MYDKINVTVFVSQMGHDFIKVKNITCKWLNESGLFNTTVVGWDKDAVCSVEEFMANELAVKHTDVFVFACGDNIWTDKNARKVLEDAVSGGTGIVALHGVQPVYNDWAEFEKMVGLMWRDGTGHGDYTFHDVKMSDIKHPITEGVEPFRTKEELYYKLVNPQNVPYQVLVTGYSPKELINRHAIPGTGKDEPVVTAGSYGKGRTINFILGHIWPYYTEHGLFENTTLSYKPPQVKTLLLRSIEWAATGKVEKTKDC